MPSPSTAPSPRPRGRRFSPWHLGVPVVAALAGFLFATSGVESQGHDFRVERNLPDEVRAQDRQVQAKTKRAQQLRGEVERLTATNGAGDARLQTVQTSTNRSRDAAALTAVRGPAIRVTLNDAQRSADSLPEGFTGDDIVVHQQDVQAVVNALWANGAEAIMIQDQRIISTSAVRCVGNTLLLQGRVYSPPYVITAVGDVDRMDRGLQADSSLEVYREYVDAVGLGYNVERPGTVQLPGYTGGVEPKHAKAVR